MDIIIRQGTTDDVPYISRLAKENLDINVFSGRRYEKEEVETCRAEYTRDLHLRIELKNLMSLIAEDRENNQPVGFCLLEELKEPVTGEREIYINNIIVEEEYRGEGISHRLMEKAEDFAWEMGIPVLSAHITVTNYPSMIFTTKYFNYKQEKTLLLKYLD